MRCELSRTANITSSRKSRGSLQWASSSTSPSMLAHVATSRPISNQAATSSPQPESPKVHTDSGHHQVIFLPVSGEQNVTCYMLYISTLYLA